MSEELMRRLRRGLLLPLVALAALAALTIPGSAGAAGTGPGSITVTATDSGGNVAGATVDVYPYSSSGNYNSTTLAGTQSTAATNGTYTVSGLTDGTPYVVEVIPSATSNDLPTWFQSTANAANATQITIPSTGTSANTATAAVTMVAGGEVTGTIQNSSGNGVGGVLVTLANSGGATSYSGLTGTNGVYTIYGVPTGSYDAYIDASSADTASAPTYYNYTSQWYGAAGGTDAGLNQANASAFKVAAGVNPALTTVALGNGSEITGTVKDANTALQGDVEVTDASGNFDQGVSSNAAGAYTVYGVPTGNFYVDFAGPWTNPSGTSVADASGYYAGSSIVDSQNQATPVAITAAGSMPTANATLPAAGYISGTVTGNGSPAAGVQVELFDSSGNQVGFDSGGNQVAATAITQSDGTYTTAGLLPGTYKVEFVPSAGNLAFQYYNGVTTLAAATSVTVTAGQTAGSVNGTLTTGGTVSGTVTSAATKAGLNQARVELLDGSGNVVSTALTGADGNYTLTGAAAGNYYVEFIPPANTGSQYQVQYYGASQTLSGSSQITVASGKTTSGVSAALVPATTAGQVTSYIPYSPQLTSTTPTFTGSLKVGSKLTSHVSGWTSGTQFAYQWYAGTKAIKGATSSTYTLTGSQYKQVITLVVTGEASGYTWKSVASAASKAVGQGSLSTKTPSIGGTARVGDKLTAKTGSWTKGTKFSYQWYANKKAIKHATKSTFKLAGAERGKTVTVKVTGKLSGYKNGSKTSKPTKRVG